MDDIHDIKPPEGIATGTHRTTWVIGACVLAFGGLAVWRWRRMCAGDAGARAVRAALTRLAAEAAGLDDRVFYYRLAGLLRLGIEARWRVAATHMTTEELLPRLRELALPEARLKSVIELLRRCDLARYAGQTLSPELRATDLTTTQKIVGRRWA
ncbi:MAG: hypothetical protein AB9872_16770 [Solidesulfovibrio sp.]